jgi:hypothetical protein
VSAAETVAGERVAAAEYALLAAHQRLDDIQRAMTAARVGARDMLAAHQSVWMLTHLLDEVTKDNQMCRVDGA